MPATLATVTAITKTVFEPPMRKQLNDKTKALKRIERTSRGVSNKVSGKWVEFPLHYKRNSGIGARREMETLPTAGAQGTTTAQVGLKFHYGAIQLSGQAIALVDTDYNSFLSALELETSRIRDDLAVDMNRQVYGNGTGAIATTSTATASTTATITSGFNQLQLDMVIDVYTPANLAADSTPKASGLTIVSRGAGTITVSSSVTWAAGDIIVRAGNANREWTGLGAIVTDSGVLYGVNPATVDIWKASVDANSGTPRALSEGLMIKTADQIEVNGASASVIMTSLGVRRSYFNLLNQQRQFTNTKEFDGGFSGLGFFTDAGEIPVVADKDCPTGTMYFLDESHMKIYQDADWAFMQRDGNMWYRIPDKDAYGARLFKYSELGADQRNAFAVIRDIQEAN